VQSRQGAGARALSPLDWAGWAETSPLLLKKNPKIVKPIFLGLLFSLEFNKNSFVIFSGNKEF
jgi:hypothetical protein